jgi:hypothetical protein
MTTCRCLATSTEHEGKALRIIATGVLAPVLAVTGFEPVTTVVPAP